MLTNSALLPTAARPGLTLDCVCNHPENAHSMTGRCRVPGCPCEVYQPMPEVAGQQTPWPPSRMGELG